MRDNTSSIDTSVYGWWILALTSLLMFGNYYVYDAIGPVASQLESELGFTDAQIGSLNAIYSLPNIFLVLVGGIIIDRFGAARVAMWTTALCLAGYGAFWPFVLVHPGIVCLVLFSHRALSFHFCNQILPACS